MIWEKLQSDELNCSTNFYSSSASNMFYAFENLYRMYLFLVCVRKSKDEKMKLNERMRESNKNINDDDDDDDIKKTTTS